MKRNPSGASGPRSNAWSECKYSNLTPYDPFDSQVYKIINQHYDRLQKKEADIFYYAYEPCDGLQHPLSLDGIKRFVQHVPPVFLTGLKGIFLCPGSKKQQRARSIIYGMYNVNNKSIFLFPAPVDLCFYYKNKPKPSDCIEYERHGAEWHFENDYWKLQLSQPSLRSFYLRDVLVHEIGHHVDIWTLSNNRNTASEERFAE